MNRETMTSTQGATASPEFLRPKDISEIINDLFQYYFKNFGRILGAGLLIGLAAELGLPNSGPYD